MIEALHLHKSYGRQAVLRDFSLEAKAGSVTLIAGANGAGKTTSLRIMAGLARPSSGQVRIAGIDLLRHRRLAQEQLSFLPQGVQFHPRLTCRQLLDFYGRLRGANPGRVDELLELAGLDEEADKPSGKLSGGLRQRLGLAVLLLPNVPVRLLDEPGLSLDPLWRLKLQSLLRAEAEQGRTVVLATHLLAEWEGMADCCYLCKEGRIAGELDPANLRASLFATPPKLFAA